MNAKSVIAQGAGVDVQAGGIGAGASATINPDHSDYDLTETIANGGGAASITTAGTNSNIEAPPLLATDQIHQLPGSPTVNAGATDKSSGSADIDGQLRTIGSAVDIGADELGDATSTAVACNPATPVIGHRDGDQHLHGNRDGCVPRRHPSHRHRHLQHRSPRQLRQRC